MSCGKRNDKPCFLTDLDEDNVVEVYEGDLILDDTYKAKPYCIYAATGGVVALGTKRYMCYPLALLQSIPCIRKKWRKCQEFLQLVCYSSTPAIRSL